MNTPYTLRNLWDVLMLFVIPIGGGIPAGVILAQKRMLGWPVMCALYFVSDILLALTFEPLMLLFLRGSERSARLARVRLALAQAMKQSTARFGVSPGPFTLVMIAFGIDPMTGRVATRAAGHGFFSGWALTIAGDMIFFCLIMASTLWLNGLLGNGTWAAMIVLVLMFVIPMIVRRIRG